MLKISVASIFLLGCGSLAPNTLDGGAGGGGFAGGSSGGGGGSAGGSGGGSGGGAQLPSAVELTGFGANPGALKMFLYTPSRPAAKPALVVAMHGCTQSAGAYQGSGWNAAAERGGFYVLYPEEESAYHCFLWFDSGNNRRGSGQAASIAEAVAFVINQRSLDAGRVFATGLSAGGGMTAVLLASYPDVFKAGAIMAGIPYRCADSFVTSGLCSMGVDLTPQAWGDLARSGLPGFTGTWPRVSLWSGDADPVVYVKNLTELMEQWTNVHGIDQTVDSTSTLGLATRREFKDSTGVTLVETWTLVGMGHGLALDPPHGCGSAAAFMFDVGLCSTSEAVKFFGL